MIHFYDLCRYIEFLETAFWGLSSSHWSGYRGGYRVPYRKSQILVSHPHPQHTHKGTGDLCTTPISPSTLSHLCHACKLLRSLSLPNRSDRLNTGDRIKPGFVVLYEDPCMFRTGRVFFFLVYYLDFQNDHILLLWFYCLLFFLLFSISFVDLKKNFKRLNLLKKQQYQCSRHMLPIILRYSLTAPPPILKFHHSPC